MLKKVAIQGIHGAFHEIAAQRYFRDLPIEIVECVTFDEITEMLAKKEIDFGLMAIENTVAGSLLSNYVLLRESPVKIIGEEYLRIKQNLLTLPGQKMEDIKEVHSHFMAINQCREFFKQYPWIKLVESSDTAVSAREINLNKSEGLGAIASELAADMYGLEILAEGIETNKRNYTRFLVLANQDEIVEHSREATKASLCFSLPHRKGSLAGVLGTLAENDLNLTKIQSMPILGKEFRYFFYVDVTFNNYTQYLHSIFEISPQIVDFQILGEYTHAIESLENVHNM